MYSFNEPQRVPQERLGQREADFFFVKLLIEAFGEPKE